MKTNLMCLALAITLLYPRSVEAQTCPTPSQLDTDLTAAAVGAVISLAGVAPLTCPEVSMTQTWSGGKLIFSDSPESPTTTGKLYKDTTLAATSGTTYNRIFNYHVNSSGSNKRLVVVLKNTSGSSGTLTLQKKGLAGPSTSFAYTGKLAYQRWTDSTAGSGTTVTAGSVVHLDSTYNTTNVATGNLYHGIWDYSFTQTHEIHICMLLTTDTATTVCPTASVLTRDSHKRGTFDYADKVYDSASGVSVDTADGVSQFPIAGNTTNDSDATGWDNAVATPTAETLPGNFGVLYKMHIQTDAADSQNFGWTINPRAGSWGGSARVMAGIIPTTNSTPLLPSGSGTSSDNTKVTVAGRYTPSTGLNIWQQFMPTGGVSFPVRVVLVPH
jgi:hypothetical protein